MPDVFFTRVRKLCAREACRAEFRPKTPRQAYCNEECRWRGGYERRAAQAADVGQRGHASIGYQDEKRNCWQCGAGYNPNHPRQRFCGEDCRYEARLARERAKTANGREVSTCAHPECRKAFVPTHGHNAYCSAECQYDARLWRYHSKQSPSEPIAAE